MLVYMNARKMLQEKVQTTEGPKLYPVIYEQGRIYDLSEPAARQWIKLHVALPIGKDGKLTLRDQTVKKLTPAKIATLTAEPLRPYHFDHAGARPTLDDQETVTPAPKAGKKKSKKKTASKKKTTRKKSKRGGKKKTKK